MEGTTPTVPDSTKGYPLLIDAELAKEILAHLTKDIMDGSSWHLGKRLEKYITQSPEATAAHILLVYKNDTRIEQVTRLQTMTGCSIAGARLLLDQAKVKLDALPKGDTPYDPFQL
jgi:hypothetical protein